MSLCGVGCLTGLSSWGFVGWVNGQLYKRVGLTRDLFGDEFPFFVERLYEIKFVWD